MVCLHCGNAVLILYDLAVGCLHTLKHQRPVSSARLQTVRVTSFTEENKNISLSFAI